MALNDNDAIVAGVVYRFSFTADSLFTIAGFEANRIRNSGLPVRNVEVSRGLFSSDIQVTFVWTVSGWTVKQVYQNLERALSEGIGNYTFTGGSRIGSGSVGEIPPVSTGDGSLLDRVLNPVAGISGTTLILGVGVFLFLFAIIIYAPRRR